MRAALITRIAVVALLGVLVSYPVSAQTESEKVRALALIGDFTARVCPRPSVDGGRKTVSGKADLSAELKGLTRALIDVKGAIGAQAETVSWDGVAQSDIARALESADKCTIEITKLLVPRFIPEFREPPVAPPPAPGISDAPAARASPVSAQYGARNENGVMVWRYGRHPSSGDCLTRLASRSLALIPFSGESTRASECFLLPTRPVCSFEAFDGGPAYPVCYWTAAACESDYSRTTGAATGRDEARKVRRSGCEEIEWGQAAGIYELWSNPKAHGAGQLPWLLSHSASR